VPCRDGLKLAEMVPQWCENGPWRRKGAKRQRRHRRPESGGWAVCIHTN